METVPEQTPVVYIGLLAGQDDSTRKLYVVLGKTNTDIVNILSVTTEPSERDEPTGLCNCPAESS
jgi:hypothetical protein